jgi:hypothetical protein
MSRELVKQLPRTEEEQKRANFKGACVGLYDIFGIRESDYIYSIKIILFSADLTFPC